MKHPLEELFNLNQRQGGTTVLLYTDVHLYLLPRVLGAELLSNINNKSKPANYALGDMSPDTLLEAPVPPRGPCLLT